MNKKEQAEYQRKWRELHPGYNTAAARLYRAKNPSYDKKWRDENKDKLKKQDRERRRNNRVFVDGIKTHYGCMNPNCFWNGPFESHVLDFHHLEPKSFNMGVSMQRSRKQLIQEINKCTILCSNCHRMEVWSCQEFSLLRCKLDTNGNFERKEINRI